MWLRLGPLVLPRRLAPVLPSPYSSEYLHLTKAFPIRESTLVRSVTLARIAKNSRLLHPVGLGIVSQIPSLGSFAKNPYRSSAWWAITPPTT